MPRKPTADDVLYDVARRRLAVYIGLVHRTDDGTQALPPRHLEEVVIPAIMDDSLGDTLIVAPPGSVKTNTMIGACAWWLGQDPTIHVAYVCNTGPEAEKRSLAIRDTVEQNGFYRRIFPGAVPDPKRGWAANAWYLQRPNKMDKNPSLSAFGVGGGLGARLHRLVLDDIADEDNQKTELQRKNLHSWMAQTLSTRMHPTKGRIIMICTRWHEDDPAAYAIEKGWHVIRIPALDEKGESYWPGYFPSAFLSCADGNHSVSGQCCKRKELGALGFARQYMGVVENDESNIFKRQWWHRSDGVPAILRGVITIDTAGWDNQSDRGDFAAVCVAGWDGEKTHILDVIKDRLSFNEVERLIQDVRTEFPYNVVVEDVPWAKPLIDRLRVSLGWGVIPWKVQGRSKFNRAQSVSPLVEDGSVLIPAEGRWVQPFIDELALFPDGKHDDQVDAFVMAVSYLTRGGGPKKKREGILPFRRQWDLLRA